MRIFLGEENFQTNQYFLGTMLFTGDYAEGTDREIQVVDGQQRLFLFQQLIKNKQIGFLKF